ncbi:MULTISPECIES: minor capsid protein [Acinetobacter]|uniref:minor capsid protein n=1 Tax=Acinetobacter TaxID=469 RepID=UPI00125F34D1|nr:MULTISPECIES: minor capsid protein [Acinetobacter]BCX73972.1 head morphogenesis protein [Acinetobacter sp. Tol 5]
MNDPIIDALTKHNSFLQRLSSSAIIEIIQSFNGISNQYISNLRDLLDELSDAELKALASAAYTTPVLKEIQDLFKEWQQSIALTLPEVFTASAVALAVHEAGYIYRMASKKTPKVDGEKLLKKVSRQPFAGGQLIDLIFPDVAESMRKKAEYIIRDGVSNGQSNQQIIQRIKGTKKLEYKDGLLEQTRNSIDAEVRTARAHISNETYLNTWKDLGAKYTKDIATLDSRTSKLCAVRDGRVQKIDENHERPPYHRRCRTIQVACNADGDIDGVRPYVVDKEKGKDWGIGQVDANTTYKQWFATQDETFQRNWLGKTRFELYKSGKYPLDKFIDPLSGKPFTIAELRKMDEDTFKELGL